VVEWVPTHDSEDDANVQQPEASRVISEYGLEYGDIVHLAERHAGYYVNRKKRFGSELNAAMLARIEDPLEFYQGVSFTPFIRRLVLSAAVHTALLTRLTGGRPVHASREVWLARGESNTGGNVVFLEWVPTIRSPRSRDINGRADAVVECRLDASTPEVYLGDAVSLALDPMMERRRVEMRRRHLEYGRSAAVRDYCYCVDADGNRAPSSRIVELVKDDAGLVSAIKMDHEETFRMRVVNESHGPFKNVPVWSDCKRVIWFAATETKFEIADRPRPVVDVKSPKLDE
jgi:hypothetical protein